MKIASITIARNEEKYLPSTINSLCSQTLPLDLIIVVNDGSTDNTGKIARQLGCIVIDLPFHEKSYTGTPELAKIINVGLDHIKKTKVPFDFVLIVGADHALPENYLKEITQRMISNPKLVVASGRIKGEPYRETSPRGSGRVVQIEFWKKVNDLRYPVEWGWESWLSFKAMQMGYETRCFRDVLSRVQRPTGLGKTGMWGKGMWALGYDWKYVLGRCFLTFFKSPKAGLSMFWGWARHENAKHLDVADWVNQMQKKRFWESGWQIIKRGGRR